MQSCPLVAQESIGRAPARHREPEIVPEGPWEEDSERRQGPLVRANQAWWDWGQDEVAATGVLGVGGFGCLSLQS